VVERYWIFATICLLVGLVLIRLIFRERVTLQGSLFYFLFLLAMMAFALFPESTAWLSHRMGFTLPSNFLFAVTLGSLALLHLGALITLSRVELRTIALTQELGILKEMLTRSAAANSPRELAPKKDAAQAAQ
jgi:hypothetical protein